MAIENKTKVIGDAVYGINTYPTSKSVVFLTRLTKVFGDAVPTFFDNIQTSVKDVEGLSPEEVFQAASKAVHVLVNNMDKDNVPELIEQMVKVAQTTKDDKLINYETDFAGSKIGDLIQVLIFIVMENYGNVFQASAIKS